jgi:hypothetical protein
MRVTLESTTQIVEFNGLPARVWEGTSEKGIPVTAFITRIAPAIENPPAHVVAEFERDLLEQRPPETIVAMVLAEAPLGFVLPDDEES